MVIDENTNLGYVEVAGFQNARKVLIGSTKLGHCWITLHIQKKTLIEKVINEWKIRLREKVSDPSA